MTFETLGAAEDRSETFVLRGLDRARLNLVICTHLSLCRILCFVSVLCSGGPLFRTDLSVLWLRRIDHLSDRSQSPRLQDRYRQKTPQGQCESIWAFSFSEKLRGSFRRPFT
jgi:hypothetical protein